MFLYPSAEAMSAAASPSTPSASIDSQSLIASPSGTPGYRVLRSRRGRAWVDEFSSVVLGISRWVPLVPARGPWSGLVRRDQAPQRLIHRLGGAEDLRTVGVGDGDVGPLRVSPRVLPTDPTFEIVVRFHLD